MDRKEYLAMAKEIFEQEEDKYKKQAHIGRGDGLSKGLIELGGEMERRGIDLSSDRAKETIRAYSLGYIRASRQHMGEYLSDPELRESLKDRLKKP